MFTNANLFTQLKSNKIQWDEHQMLNAVHCARETMGDLASGLLDYGCPDHNVLVGPGFILDNMINTTRGVIKEKQSYLANKFGNTHTY